MKKYEMSSRLQELRKAKGYTQQSLSMETGIPISTIQKIETGDRKIGKVCTEINFVLSKVLDVTIEDLLSVSET